MDGASTSLRTLKVDVNGPRGLALTVHQKLRQVILDGSLGAGTILNQAELARAFGVSRTPMREAFRMLQEEGLIRAEPDRRAVAFQPAQQRHRAVQDFGADPVSWQQRDGAHWRASGTTLTTCLPHGSSSSRV